MAGTEVTKTAIDARTAEAVLALREAFRKCDNIAEWLTKNPVVSSVDPLVTTFVYSEQEAADIRTVFTGFAAAHTTLAYNFDVARNLVGLE
jgi:hypothetical protein